MKFAHPIRETANIDGCTLVVYNWSDLSETTSPRDWENVEFFDAEGNKLWTVNGMDECPYWAPGGDSDSFVGPWHMDGKWGLTTFSGNAYFIDLKTGKVTFKRFVK